MKNLANQQCDNFLDAFNNCRATINMKGYETLEEVLSDVNRYCIALSYPKFSSIFDLNKQEWFEFSVLILKTTRNLDFYGLARTIGLSM